MGPFRVHGGRALAYDIPTTEPANFIAGDSWKWDKSLGDYPAGDGWELYYRFVSESTDSAELVTTWGVGNMVAADGDDFEVRIPKASTNLAPGSYTLYGYVDDGTDRHSVLKKRVIVQANPASVAGTKSLAKTMLDAIDARLEARVLTSEQRRIRINGRELEYATDAELYKARSHWALMYELERNPNARLQGAARFTG